jgi:4-amino-4-deoxy-L-arabinose transferase-like glycosyltransferase
MHLNTHFELRIVYYVIILFKNDINTNRKMKKLNKYLIFILVLSAVLRLLFLDTHVGALYGDEISIGYNAWSVLKTGKDEFGRYIPLQFESWGDQKNPVYIYLVAIFEIFFGLTAWSVRLPSAISGITAVALTYLIIKQLFKLSQKEEKNTELIALISAFLLGINPWHIHISRGGYEANLALTLGLGGIYYFLKWFEAQNENRNTKNNKQIYFFSSIVLFALAMYTYYTTKLFVPLLIILLWVWTGFVSGKIKQHFKQFTIYFIIFIALCIPVIYLALFSNGQARFQSINIFKSPDIEKRVHELRHVNMSNPTLSAALVNKPFIWVRDFLEYYGDNFSPLFWYIAGDSSLRYSIGNHGMFYLIEWPLFLYGLIALYIKNKKVFTFLFLWLILAPIPTALVGKSYGLRSLAMLPVPLVFVSVGIVFLKELFPTNLKLFNQRNLTVTVFAIIAFSFANWIIRYSYLYSQYGYYWYDGMQKDAIEFAMKNKNKYEKIIISKLYGKTEMYYAFYTKMDPAQYQKLSLQKTNIHQTDMIQFDNVYFGDIDSVKKSYTELNFQPKTLVIAAPDYNYGSEEKIIARDDKRLLFKVMRVE